MQENKLYVGNIPYTVTSEDLQKHFSEAGAVKEAIIITDKMTRRPKGFGFVEMADAAGAEKAISMFNGQDFMGRDLTVNLAKPMQPRENRDRNDRGGRRF